MMKKLVASLVLLLFCSTAYSAEFLGEKNGKYLFFDNGIERSCTWPESYDKGRTYLTECTTGNKTYICIPLTAQLGYLDCNAGAKVLRLFI